MTIIPAIDIIGGKCVRLTRGDYGLKKIYNEDPLEVAMQFEDAGLDRLHLVDLDGARSGTVRNWKILERIAAKTNLGIDFSGGLNSQADLKIVFDTGAYYAAIGTMAVTNEEVVSEWLINYGTDRFIISVDALDEKVSIRGWTEQPGLTIMEMIGRYTAKDVTQFCCTDISKDGMLSGPSIELYTGIIKADPGINLIASGGISCIQDLEVLEKIGCKGAIIGKAIYENRISLKELKNYADKKDNPLS